jgi:hypothetical protein
MGHNRNNNDLIMSMLDYPYVNISVGLSVKRLSIREELDANNACGSAT